MRLHDIVRPLRQLLFPASCPVCGKMLTASEHFVCIHCHLSAPFTNLWQSRENLMEQRFWGQVPIERAAAFLWFIEGSRWQELIHNFKHHSHWYYAENIGQWLATELSQSDFFDGIDLILPVPLHWKRQLHRGYNQAEHLAAGISRQSGIPLCFNAVRRRKNNPPQAQMRYTDRWDNTDSLFEVTHPEELLGKHILLIDDVFTTGATLISLAQTIRKCCNDNVRISVSTLSASRHLMNM